MKMKSRRKTKIKKGILAVMLCIVILVASLPPIVSPASTAVEAASGGATSMAFVIGQNTYTVNGLTITMDVSPTVIEDRTMLPVRFVAEPLGAAVSWDEATNKVTVQLMDTKIELWIGQSNALVNGVSTPIDPDNPNVKPLTLNDRTMLPVRFVTENLGCNVGWDEATQQVSVVQATGGGASTAPGSDLTGGTDAESDNAPKDPGPPVWADDGEEHGVELTLDGSETDDETDGVPIDLVPSVLDKTIFAELRKDLLTLPDVKNPVIISGGKLEISDTLKLNPAFKSDLILKANPTMVTSTATLKNTDETDETGGGATSADVVLKADSINDPGVSNSRLKNLKNKLF